MLTCRRATERMSRALDGPLPVGARIGLYAHLALCGRCARFRRQLWAVHAACRGAADAAPPGAGPGLPAAARARIAAALAAAPPGDD